METPFAALAELCEKLEATTKRLLMIDLVSEFLKSLSPGEVEPAVSMILGRALPKWSTETLEVSWATLSETIRGISGVDSNRFMEAFSQTGDVGSATKLVFDQSGGKRQATLLERTLIIMEVRRSFERIAEATGYGSREKKMRLVQALLSSASSLEVKFLVRIFISGMRTGLYEGLMEQAVSKAFEIPLEDVQRAGMIAGDVAEVASIAKTQGIEGLLKIGFIVFKPVTLMLAQMASDVGEALKEHGGTSAFEHKLDGARVQIHKLGDEVRIFSRRLTDVTGSLPEIVELTKRNVKDKEAILEGEVIAVDRHGNPIPFQHLMRRFKRVHDVGDMVKEVPVKLYLFDVLFLDGKSLITIPYSERRRILAENAGEIPLAKQLVTGKVDEAERFLKEALDAGHEGLMAKKVDSPYTPGIRGKRWFKIKPVLEPLDLVIVAAEWGYGRRHEWLSDYYLAARDAETGELLTVGKTFKGLTDAEIIAITNRLKESVVEEEPRRVVVVPKIVVEVTYNEIQRSPTYKSGMALRFARINRIRDEKTVEEADTIQRVREIYEKQFLKKGRFKADLQK